MQSYIIGIVLLIALAASICGTVIGLNFAKLRFEYDSPEYKMAKFAIIFAGAAGTIISGGLFMWLALDSVVGYLKLHPGFTMALALVIYALVVWAGIVEFESTITCLVAAIPTVYITMRCFAAMDMDPSDGIAGCMTVGIIVTAIIAAIAAHRRCNLC